MVSAGGLSLLGMIQHHVTTVAAIFVCNLLLCSAHSAPNAALLKLLAAKHSHSSNRAATSYLNEYNPAFPSDLSDDDVNQLWLDPGLARIDNSPTSGGSRMLSSEEEGEGEDAMLGSSQVKRFHPSAFFGSRGKRMYGGLSSAYAKRFQQGLLASRAERLPYSGGEGQQVAKRFDPSGFSGSRGKRYMPGLEALFLSQMYKKLDAEKWKRQSLLGFHAARG